MYILYLSLLEIPFYFILGNLWSLATYNAILLAEDPPKVIIPFG